MADISRFLQDILDAVYGEQVRGSIHDAIELINDVSEVVLTTGTAITSPTDSTTGFYENSLYLNTNTFELWKCIGVNVWQSQGNLKGAAGNGIDNITKTATAGLVDTYTITYTDGTSDTFDVTNGENGNRWYRGLNVSGKAVLPTVYPTGIADAHENDFYLNPSEGAVYHCVTGGSDTVATWSYDFTMTGGGGGGSVVTWTQVQASGTKIAEIDIDGSTQNVYAPESGSDVSWTQIQAATGATQIATITIDGTPQNVYAPTGGGGGASELDDLSDVTITGTPSQGETLIANSSGIFENHPMPQGGHTMLPTPSSSVNESAVVSAINTAITTDGGANDDVASLFGVGKWSNTISKTYVVQGSTKVGTSGIGTWPADPDNPTAAEKATWVTVPLLVGCASNTGLDIKLTFDPTTVSVPIVLGGYIIDDSDGKMCIKFGNEIPSADTATAKIGIELIIKRTENEIAIS